MVISIENSFETLDIVALLTVQGHCTTLVLHFVPFTQSRPLLNILPGEETKLQDIVVAIFPERKARGWENRVE